MSPNLFAGVPDRLPDEWVQVLTESDAVRIERIVSRGHRSPDEYWYDQDRDEFVVLLSGSAGLVIEGQDDERVLNPGDWLVIPAHQRHRVEWTEAGTDTVWLAVHFGPAK